MQHISGRWMKALNGIVIALSLVLPGTTQAQSLESLVNVQDQGKPTCWLQPGGGAGRNRG